MAGTAPKVITLRKLSPELARALRHVAQERRTSLNQTVLGLLEERLGLSKPGSEARRHHDLDALAGAWTEAEADAFAEALADQRQIDPDLWR